ncbi:hypothetical protein DFH28DRAFT_1056978 [Melampsora americana]|nr:hypothetical protein DFH28DRAFT_1056978 [Melampsora americana]
MSYSELLEHIQSIQKTFDEVPPPPNGVQRRLLPSLILGIWDAQADLRELEGGHDLNESDIGAWLEATATEGRLLDQLNQISIDANLEISLVNLLPTPGSPNWYRLCLFASIMNDSSFVVQTQSDLSEEEREKCPICIENFDIGERCVTISPNEPHWMHEKCFTSLARCMPDFTCPMCRQRPSLT